MKQPSLFQRQEVKREIRRMLSDMDQEERMSVLSRLVLDQVREMISKFPDRYQKEIIALLVDGFMEQWKRCDHGS